MQEFYRNNKIFIDKLLLLLIIAACTVLAVFLAGYIAPFVVGYIISLILSPIVGIIHTKWRINRGITAAVLILLLIAAIIFLGGFLISRIGTEMAALMQDFPQYISGAQVHFENAMASIENMLGTGLEIDFAVILNQLLNITTGLLQGALEGGAFLTAIPFAVIRVLLTIISAFFFIKDKELIKQSVAGLFPKRFVARFRIVRQGILKALVGYVKGQLIIMTYVSTICIIGLSIIRSPYALFIGLGIGLFDLIPVFGAGGILIPWAIYHIIAGNITFAIGLLVIYGVVFLSRQMLEPRIVGNKIGMHPIILLMSVYIGVSTIGPIGIFAGPLVVLTIKTTMEANLASLTDGIKKRESRKP
ncbi:MAG: sporulation integral membrane protein YtvI [Defluviitaleaceae bacterium]|nr:sporulation integral membrane protein YtvI [Defluviitaleaceae bacterium]